MAQVSLRDRLQTEVTAAMRSGDTLRRDVLRMALSAAYNLEKRTQKPLTEDDVVAILTREVKTRRESIEAFQRGHREDLAAKEQAEVTILQEFLPQALSDDELRTLIAEGVAVTGASSARDLGKVMGWLAPRTRGKADGRHVSELVAQRLAASDLAAHAHPPGSEG
jgi:uncharacterized protein YqeY